MNEKKVLIYGLGRSGMSLAWYLLSRGAEVFVYDDDPNAYSRPELQTLLKSEGVHPMIGIVGIKADVAIISPGIPDDKPAVKDLRWSRNRVIDELEYGFEVVGKKIIAVTGTNGKSTVTTLLGEMLKADGRSSFYGGNLAPGRPFSSALMEPPKEFYCLEVSSFQLERCEKFAPRVAVLLNISPDHLDRHKRMERYVELKLSVFRNQAPDDYAVVNGDDETIMKNRAAIPATVVTFALANPSADARVESGVLQFRGENLMPATELQLPGRHNVANALAALAAAKLLNVKNESIVQVLRTFKGLEHRLESVKEFNGVRYINNSMCTNPAAAVHSLLAFDAPVILITGGREKNLPITEYVRTIAERAKAAILVGENRRFLAESLKKIGFARLFPLDGLENALRKAKELAQPGDVVLFSPGFASFDAYKSFQERGQAFKNAVREICQ